MQFQAPSSVQAPVCVPATPPVEAGGEALAVVVATGTEEDAGAEDAGAEDTGAEEAGAEDEAGTEAEVAVLSVVGVATPPVVRKTPPVGVL